MKRASSERRIGARLPQATLSMRWSESSSGFLRRRATDYVARVLNVSMTGALIETDTSVKLKFGAVLRVTIGDVPVAVEVVRFEPGPDDDSYHYGVVFRSHSEPLQELVRGLYPVERDRETLDFWLSAR